MLQISFTAAIEPLPQARCRFGRGRAFEPARMKEYKAAVEKAARAAMKNQQPTTAAISCKLRLFRKFNAISRRFGDADNLAKSIMDACNGVVWKDDAQIVSLTAEKIKSTVPRVEVEIETVDGEGFERRRKSSWR